MSVFGTLTTLDSVENRVRDFIAKWLPTYLAEIERQTDTRTREIVRPAMYRVTRDPGDDWPEDMKPAILVSAEPDEPEVTGHGIGYWFDVHTAAIVGGIDEDDARRVAGYYGVAMQALVVQNGTLDGLSESTHAVGLKLDDLGENEARTSARAAFEFRIFVPGFVDPAGGPDRPDPKDDPDDAYGDWPHVSGVDITVDGFPPNG